MTTCVFHFVQDDVVGDAGEVEFIQRWKKRAEEWEDIVKKNQEAVTNIDKEKEQYAGES